MIQYKVCSATLSVVFNCPVNCLIEKINFFNFIRMCLEHNLEDRLTVQQIFEHPFFQVNSILF